MAARADAATDRVTLNAAPSVATLSIGGWFKVDAASAGSINTIWRLSLSSGDSTTWILAFRGTNGRTPTLYSPSNTTGIAAPEQALGAYVYLLATLNGTAAQLLYGNTPGSLSKVTGTVAASNTPDRLCVFGRSAGDGSDPLNGTAAYLRLWERVLTDPQGAAESAAVDPVGTANLWADYDFAAASLADSLGVRNLTAGTTPLSAAADPVLSSGRSQAVGTVDLTVAPIKPGRTRTRTLGLAAPAVAAQSSGHTRARGLGTVAQTSVSLAVGRVRAATLGLAVPGVVALSPGRVRGRTLGAVDEAVALSPLGRSRSRTPPTAAQVTTPLSPTAGRQQTLGTALLPTVAIAPARIRTRALGTVAQVTSAVALERELGPWPPVVAPGRASRVIEVGAGQTLLALRVGGGQPQPVVVIGPGRVVP